MSKPSIPKGTRDFAPDVMARRQWMLGVIRAGMERHGFVPIETPAMENLSTLTGKYGDEGDQLIFKILNNGDYLAGVEAGSWESQDSKAVLPQISKKALRYDLTVPFARFVVMERHRLAMPFRRYQIQNVWRGDRPGRGRYQEFTQCDADIIGSEDPVCEWDLLLLFHEVLQALGVQGYEIVVNDRRVLAGLAEVWGIADRLTAWTVAMDKLDKVGPDGVLQELADRGFGPEVCGRVGEMLAAVAGRDAHARLAWLADVCGPAGEAGRNEVAWLLSRCAAAGLGSEHLVFDPTLARGLNYYTGAIFEVRVPGAPVGSICGGGRYADLTGIFGMPGLSGVGISFGADRIYDVLEHQGGFPTTAIAGPQLLLFRLEEGDLDLQLQRLQAARAAGISAVLYPDVSKLKKQLKYASDTGVRHVLFQGEPERQSGQVALKDMISGAQWLLPESGWLAALLEQRAAD